MNLPYQRSARKPRRPNKGLEKTKRRPSGTSVRRPFFDRRPQQRHLTAVAFDLDLTRTRFVPTWPNTGRASCVGDSSTTTLVMHERAAPTTRSGASPAPNVPFPNILSPFRSTVTIGSHSCAGLLDCQYEQCQAPKSNWLCLTCGKAYCCTTFHGTPPPPSTHLVRI